MRDNKQELPEKSCSNDVNHERKIGLDDSINQIVGLTSSGEKTDLTEFLGCLEQRVDDTFPSRILLKPNDRDSLAPLVWRYLQIPLQSSQVIVTGYLLDVAQRDTSAGHLR